MVFDSVAVNTEKTFHRVGGRQISCTELVVFDGIAVNTGKTFHMVVGRQIISMDLVESFN